MNNLGNMYRILLTASQQLKYVVNGIKFINKLYGFSIITLKTIRIPFC